MLWLLRPVAPVQKGSRACKGTAWAPYWDTAHGFVVRAETEKEARELVMGNGGDEEGSKTFIDGRAVVRNSPWSDPKQSICIALLQDGESAIILEDFLAG